MRYLIFGKNGQVARALRAVLYDNKNARFLGSADCNLLNASAAAAAIQNYMPDCVINAAAFTAVDKAETDRDAAFQLNATAPAEMADTARDVGAKFIHISTDYVFDGESETPYSEETPTNPINTYGASKLRGEELLLKANPASIILRTSWVFSATGTNFVKTMLRMAASNETVTVVDDQFGGPTSAADITNTILDIAYAKPGPAGIFHYQGSPGVCWADFAREIFSASGNRTEVIGISTSEFETSAQRPLNSLLDCSKLHKVFGISQPDWRKSLRKTIKELGAPI
ncbi:MAG: dTDP-4-dehydrorhamnose reductase [Marinicaulis sp.]|nr:dTDP-4-dehydrorhamnose reductase [Marinicaulis sp.]